MTTKLSSGTASRSHRCVICEAEIPCDNPEDAQDCLVSTAAGAPALLLGWSRPPNPLECMERSGVRQSRGAQCTRLRIPASEEDSPAARRT